MASGMTVATWNLRTMYQDRRTYNAIKEMKKLNIAVLGISKMRWTGAV